MRIICPKHATRGSLLRQAKFSSYRVQRRLASTATEAGVQECDVVIVGGGPAGLAFANALGEKVELCYKCSNLKFL